MKRKQQPVLYNSDNPPKYPNGNSSTQDSPGKTPYLKAILSGATKFFTPDNVQAEKNSDRNAALRYIKGSALLRSLYIDKLSC
jgi:hypothetical protein